MAKPLDISDNSHRSLLLSDRYAFSGNKTRSLSKNRTQGLDEESPTLDVTEESHKTRRVNPQRLAARLGAEIVAEMEDLIYPGAKMPTFEVRRVIQERYAVDRRHIYDYFHSRGLRVAKEDKHTNLTRGRLSKALARRVPEKHPPADLVCKILHSLENVPKASIVKTVCSQATVEERISHQDLIGSSQDWLAQVAPTECPAVRRKRRNAKRLASETRSATRPTMCTTTNEIFDSTSHECPPLKRRRIMSTSTTRVPSSPASKPDQLCTELIVDCNQGSSNDEPDNENFFSSGSCYDLCDLTAEFLETPPSNYLRDAPIALDDQQSLNEEERMKIYDFINTNITVSTNVLEHAGTYHAYMKQCSQLYFDGLSSTSNCRPKHFCAHRPEQRFRTDIMEIDAQVDFLRWLSDLGGQRHTFQPENTSPIALLAQSTPGCLPPNYSPKLKPRGEIGDEIDSDVSKGEFRSFSSQTGGLQNGCDVDPSFGFTSLSPFGGSTEETSGTMHREEYKLAHHRRHRNRLLADSAISSNRRDTPKQQAIILDSAFTPDLTDTYFCSPDRQNVILSSLCVPKPTRLRSVSAGGGI